MSKRIQTIITITLSCLLLSSCSILKEHQEARNVSVSDIEFNSLADGIYSGVYEGGMCQWRTTEVRVTVLSGQVTKIELLNSKEERPPEFTDTLFHRVIGQQSLRVDAVSGATLTSKAYLKAIEIALTKATQKFKE